MPHKTKARIKIRLLFLDIDGVLNNHDYYMWRITYEGQEYMRKTKNTQVDPKAVPLVEDLCKNHNIKIVVSSSWRSSYSLEATKQIFRNNAALACLADSIVGVTPRFWRGVDIDKGNPKRGTEVNSPLPKVRGFLG